MSEAAEKLETEEAPVERKIYCPAGPSLKQGEFGMLTFLYEVPPGHKLEDMLNPVYWAHHGRKLRLHSLIHAIAVDGSFDFELRVVAGGEGWTKMRVLREWYAKSAEDLRDPTPAIARLKIDHVGGLWRIIHKDTTKIMGSGYRSRGEAEAAADALARTLRNV